MIDSKIRNFWQEIRMSLKPGEWIAVCRKSKQKDRHSLSTAIRILLPQLILYYIFLSPIIAAPLYNSMLFHPTIAELYDVHQIAGVKVRNEFFESRNGKRLHAWCLQVPKSKYMILVNQGNGGNLSYRIPLIAMLLHCGASVFIYDYEGYGRSAGKPSLANICDDGIAAYDYLLCRKGLRGENIIALGESLGSGVACHIAEKRSLGGIILQAPYSSLVKIAKETISWLNLYPSYLFLEPQLNNASVLSHRHAPLLLVHGKQDGVIPYAHSEEILRTASQPTTLVQLIHSDHNDIFDADPEQYYKAVHQFLAARANNGEKVRSAAFRQELQQNTNATLNSIR